MKPLAPRLLQCLPLAAALTCSGQEPAPTPREYPKPERFEQAIRAFEELDRKAFPPPDAIVCYGSSSMRGWHSNVVADLAPLTVIPRGFGGSNMNDALHYVDRIVLPYRPRAIVLYEGDNDIAAGITPEKIRDTFRALVTKVHQQLPAVRIYVLSIKPSIKRWNLWPQMEAANRLLAEVCAGDARLTYVDVAGAMLDENRQPRKELFQKDDLHMTRAGYEIWRDRLKPILDKAELSREPQRSDDATTHP